MKARAKLRLGTRGSELARTQSGTVAASLEKLGFEVELTIIRTAGDRDTAAPFSAIGPQGVFVREIEQALVNERIELAVHSFKDLPTQSPPELAIGAVPERADPADLLLVRNHAVGRETGLAALASGARVGTASARRRVWLRHFRPDLDVRPLRGNVPTRLRKLEDGDFDAILLAAAGVDRLHARVRIEPSAITVLRLDPQEFVPAPAQGALAVQCRRGDAALLEVLRALDHAPTRLAVTAERDALARAEGGCDVAFGAYCRAPESSAAHGGHGVHELIAMHERGGRVRAVRVRGTDPAALGAAAWAELDAELDAELGDGP
jgi:hydroxymethylbilane synthase